MSQMPVAGMKKFHGLLQAIYNFLLAGYNSLFIIQVITKIINIVILPVFINEFVDIMKTIKRSYLELVPT